MEISDEVDVTTSVTPTLLLDSTDEETSTFAIATQEEVPPEASLDLMGDNQTPMALRLDIPSHYQVDVTGRIILCNIQHN